MSVAPRSQQVLQRAGECFDIRVRHRFRRRHEKEVRELGLSGTSRETGTPAMMPFAASASTTGAAGFGSFTVNSLKNALVQHLDARHLRQRIGELARAGVVRFGKLAQSRLARAASCAR